VHRDLKPSNIMVTSFGTTGVGIKVLDFGLAKLDRDATLTMTGVMMGTPAYMAPEQVEGLEAGPATDLFALGLILYEMTAGRLPIPGESLAGMMVSRLRTEAPRLSRQAVDSPPELDNLVTRLLDRDPAKRGSAAEAGAQLSAMAKRRDSVPGSPLEFWRRPAVLIPVVLCALLAILGGGWLYQRFQRQRWAVDVALPEIARLREESSALSAFRLLQQVESTLPTDPRVVEVSHTLARVVSVTSSPPGAMVEIQDYLAPGSSWYSLGTTPIDHVRIPSGYFRWRVSKAGAGEFVSAPVFGTPHDVTLAKPALSKEVLAFLDNTSAE
jgi:serine/threonine protein kinase